MGTGGSQRNAALLADTGPPGDNVLVEPSEWLSVPDTLFPELIVHCPVVTAHTVHLMLDRARRFNASDLQAEKMAALGKLAAGLAHELNNPASATVRSANLLLQGLRSADEVSTGLGEAGLSASEKDALERLLGQCAGPAGQGVLSPLELADREDDISDWLEDHGCDPADAEALAETAVTLEQLDTLAEALAPEHLPEDPQAVPRRHLGRAPSGPDHVPGELAGGGGREWWCGRAG